MLYTIKTPVLLLSSAILALPLAAISQTTSGSTSTTSTTTSTTTGTQAVPTSRLLSEYTTLAGSQKNADSLVTGLRTGAQVTLTSADGKTTAFTPPTKAMGNGNVNITLRIAQQMMANNSNLTLQQALMGTSGTQGILQMRASGMGWGQIAKTEGFKLGDVMRSGKADSASTAGRAESKSDRVARSERSEKVERAERPEKVERAERPEKVERVERAERVERVERPQRPERTSR